MRQRLRSYAFQHDPLLRIARTIRFALILGPWRGLVIRFFQRFSPNPACPRAVTTIFPGVEAEPFVTQLNKTGLAPGLALPPDYIEKLYAHSLKECVEARRYETYTGHLACPEIRQIAYDPLILDVARDYLGAEPIFYGSYLFWSHPHKMAKTQYPERYHYDVADFKSMQLYFFLTDVDEESGAHFAIEGTHRGKSVKQLIFPFLTDDEAAAKYGSRIRMMTGKSGVGFFEEQLAYHKRGICKRRRLALVLNYTLHRKPAPLVQGTREEARVDAAMQASQTADVLALAAGTGVSKSLEPKPVLEAPVVLEEQQARASQAHG